MDKKCKTCNGTSTIPTDRSDFDMCPDCNSPKPKSMEDVIKKVWLDWYGDDMDDISLSEIAQALTDAGYIHKSALIDARIEALEKELLREELYLHKLCWEVRHIASFTEGTRQQSDLAEQQRINNLVLADKCDELSKLSQKHKSDVQEIVDVYEELLNKEINTPIWDIPEVDRMWNAIKTCAERCK